VDKLNLIIIAYFGLLTLYGVTEIILLMKFDKGFRKKNDNSFFLMVLPFYLSVYLPPAEYVLFRPTLHKGTLLLGFLLLIVGILVRMVALLQLGHNFSTAIVIEENSRLITSGVYRFVRHPLYLAVLLIAISGSIIFSCLITWIFVAVTLYGVLLRIQKEEQTLLEHYPEYARYKKQTWKLVPFIY